MYPIPMYNVIYLLCAVVGAVFILFCLLLLYKKRISLDQVTNSNQPGDAIKADIMNLIKISSNVPAIGLFVIGLILLTLPVIYVPKALKKYTIEGTVKKEDASYAKDITVLTKYPPSLVTVGGEIGGVEVWADLDGKLPTLYFVTPQYDVTWVNLNEHDKVDFEGDVIKIKSPVILRRIPKE
jgi:hypothetical protein